METTMNTIFENFNKYKLKSSQKNNLKKDTSNLDLLKIILQFTIIIINNTKLFLHNAENSKFLNMNLIKFKSTNNNLKTYLFLEDNVTNNKEYEKLKELNETIVKSINILENIRKNTSINSNLSNLQDHFNKVFLLIKIAKKYKKNKDNSNKDINENKSEYIDSLINKISTFNTDNNNFIIHLRDLFVSSNKLYTKSNDKNDCLFLLLYLYIKSNEFIKLFGLFINSLKQKKNFSNSSIQKIFNEVKYRKNKLLIL